MEMQVRAELLNGTLIDCYRTAKGSFLGHSEFSDAARHNIRWSVI